MILNTKESEEFCNFAKFVDMHTKGSYRLRFNDNSIINCVFDTDCESDNCLDLDDPNYEEYWMIVFRDIATNELFEVNYHNMPVEIWCDGEKVDLLI